ncbi:MAG: proline dehydrogenase family protein [Acidimicrobiales bacterium]
MSRGLDNDVTALARRIAELGSGQRSKVFRMSWWSERMLDWAMARPGFKTQLFRFVDVFPAMTDDADVLRHIEQYFEGHDVPRALDLGIDVADHVPFGKNLSARVARRNIRRMAEQFIVGQSPAEAVAGLHELWRRGSAHTIDLLGEKTVVQSEADRYRDRVLELLTVLSDAAQSWAPDDHLERDDLGPLRRVNVSIKPTALATHYEPLTREEGLRQAKERIRPILRLAEQRRAFVNFDMEHYDVKDLTLQLFRELLQEGEFAEAEAGIVIQAYLKDSRDDLADLIAWSAQRRRPITVRVVKGAYWDTESIHARAEGWPVPLFEDKEQTDANFERCVRLLHDHHGEIRAAFGSHNLRSIAYAITYARQAAIPDAGYEIQMLYGMAEPMHAAVKRLGLRLRVYAPVGELVPGMAYLVRRLLENTSNESFVRHRFADGRDLDDLLRPPRPDAIPGPTEPPRRQRTDPADPGDYEPEPLLEWRRPLCRDTFHVTVDRTVEALRRRPVAVPAVIDGERVVTAATIESVDPGRYDQVVALSASCTASDADTAVAAAMQVEERWRRTPARERAAVLFRAAEWLRSRRAEIAAIELFEAGKPWDQADADVCEAIDFCEYYGREILRLEASSARLVQSPPGETNRLVYQGKGVTAVIAPWNFPLAIPCGMTVAGLVAGDPVILKPAEQTPLVAWKLVEALTESGLPKGVLQFLPGLGEDVGARLVEHPDVAAIVFTGSKAVGLHINQTAAAHRPGQRHVKRVVAEMGGKNALIVDADADPDQAVPAAVLSAFGFAGQKCSALSRLIVLDPVYDAMVARLVGATREVPVGHPSDMGVKVGPDIDADAFKRISTMIGRAHDEGRVSIERDDVPEGGWYIGPTIVADVDPATAAVARDEIFGPVLTVLRATDFDHAIALANDTPYALTAGVFSRSPANITKAAAELRAGNVYINRHITGAVVGRQPFGGYGLSGVGSKAGGPDYLLQFLDPRVITENTVRQGFAPDT